MATIRKRANRYQAEIRYKGVQCSKTFSRKTDAREWATHTERLIDVNEHRAQAEKISSSVLENTSSKPAGQTVAEILEKLATTQDQTNPSSHRYYNRLIRLKVATVSSKTVDEVTPLDFEQYIDARREDDAVSNNTLRLELSAFSSAFKHARIKTNPLKSVERPTPGKGRTRRIWPGEFDELLKACETDCYKSMPHAFIIFIETAMRRSEFASITWRHVSLDGGEPCVLLEATKNGDQRTVPLSTRAVSAFRKIQAIRPAIAKSYVLGVSPDYLTEAWTRVRTRASCEDLRLHDLRHEAVSRFFENTDLRDAEIQKITGHRSPQMLQRYTHLRTRSLASRLG